jgi:hypothetical protein
MIERNLGNSERVLRLLAGVLLLVWALGQDVMQLVDWFVVAVSSALILNGIFSRCYLWYVLDINTCQGGGKDCQPEASCP